MQASRKDSANTAQKDFDREDWASAYQNVQFELTNQSLQVSKGVIPSDLCGTLYRNGPGQMERDGQWIHHPFDGDGMIVAVNFKNGKAFMTNRFVRTKAWEEEQQSGKFLYRGVFGTQKPGGFFANAFDIRLKNIANTNVIRLGNDLLALWEAAGPHALDPCTLETRGLSTLNGVLEKEEAFSAHPRFDPGHHGYPMMVTFGVKTGPTSTIRLMEFATQGEKIGQLLSDRKDNFSGFAFLHDFAITPNWAVFLQNSISFNPIPFILGKKGAAQCLSSKPSEQSKLWIIPRESGQFKGKEAKTFNAPPGFVFHHLNAWEEGEEIVLDSIYYADFPSIGPEQDFRLINFDLIPEGQLKRCRINISNNTMRTEVISKQCCEFAMVNPSLVGMKASYGWMATSECKQGNGPLQAIKKIDFNTGKELLWSAAPKGFLGEPLMVKSQLAKSEDDGWVIVLVWNSVRRATDLVILNAKTLILQATIEMPIGVPYGLHGSWIKS